MNAFRELEERNARNEREILKLKGQLAPVSTGNSVISSNVVTPIVVWVNGSGVDVTDGTVVIASIGSDRTFTLTTTAGDLRVLGVTNGAIKNGQNGEVRHIGYVAALKVQGAVTAGHYLKSTTFSGRAADAGVTIGNGVFALALTAFAGPGAGTVPAFVFPVVSGAGGVSSFHESLYFQSPSTQMMWINQPSLVTELYGLNLHRVRADLSPFTQARLEVEVILPGFAGATLKVQYSTDGGSNWRFLDGASGPSSLLTSIGLIDSGFVTLEALAKADVLLRVVGKDGNDVARPAFGSLQLTVKS